MAWKGLYKRTGLVIQESGLQQWRIAGRVKPSTGRNRHPSKRYAHNEPHDPSRSLVLQQLVGICVPALRLSEDSSHVYSNIRVQHYKEFDYHGLTLLTPDTAYIPDSQTTTLTPADVSLSETDVHPIQTPSKSQPLEPQIKLDIEHALVEDDPRTWSNARKVVLWWTQPERGLSHYFRGFYDRGLMQQHPEPETFQSYGVQSNIGLVIGMRMIQAAGSSAVIAIGAATLADIYEPHQRGTMMGVYYSAPLLGPSLGPIIGGALTQGLSWRAVFWFLVIWGGVIFAAFFFLFHDTFRKERSLAYQSVLKKQILEHKSGQAKDAAQIEEKHVSEKKTSEEGDEGQAAPKDVEAQPVVVPVADIKKIKLSLADVNPFPPYSEDFESQEQRRYIDTLCITYTCARTLALYYDYGALRTGLVLLAYGVGSILGSILGGRWSDRTLARLKAANGGVSFPEMRLESTKIAMWFLPPSIVGYAWVCQERVNVAAICVMLFLAGFFSIWIYASTLAYIVDANTGRSSSAVATNSSFRGTSAFVAAEIAVPLQVRLCTWSYNNTLKRKRTLWATEGCIPYGPAHAHCTATYSAGAFQSNAPLLSTMRDIVNMSTATTYVDGQYHPGHPATSYDDSLYVYSSMLSALARSGPVIILTKMYSFITNNVENSTGAETVMHDSRPVKWKMPTGYAGNGGYDWSKRVNWSNHWHEATFLHYDRCPGRHLLVSLPRRTSYAYLLEEDIPGLVLITVPLRVAKTRTRRKSFLGSAVVTCTRGPEMNTARTALEPASVMEKNINDRTQFES
ncbi:major facilitator superfamily domain-containing protein [Melanogaster broomeanus]|nr:major facilitator superfamily domain-containing protein [Melanogaster broomeanus]